MGLGFRSGVEYLTVAECVDVSTNNTIVEKSDLVGQRTSSLGHFTWYPRNRGGGEVFHVDQISDLKGSEGFRGVVLLCLLSLVRFNMLTEIGEQGIESHPGTTTRKKSCWRNACGRLRGDTVLKEEFREPFLNSSS